jgi:hypothetical protein
MRVVVVTFGAPQQVFKIRANSALLCVHTHKGISTQRRDGGEESQEGLHTEETIDGWK